VVVVRLFFRVNSQSEFSFDPDASEEGHTRWLFSRRMAVEILARKMNLPLGHQVEVWLYGGIRLRGLLRLKEEALFIEEERVATSNSPWTTSPSPTAKWNPA